MKALLLLAAVIAAGALASTARAETVSLNMVDVEQLPSDDYIAPGRVYFSVATTKYDNESFATATCDGSVDFKDGQHREFDVADDGSHDFMSQPNPTSYDPTGAPIYPAVARIDVTCDWDRTITVKVRATYTGWTTINGARYWKKQGAASVFAYIPGWLTIDNRSSARPEFVYWKVRHRGTANYCEYSFSLRYSTPGAHHIHCWRISPRVLGVRIQVSPHMKFTVATISVRYRYTGYAYEDRDIAVSGAGAWIAA